MFKKIFLAVACLSVMCFAENVGDVNLMKGMKVDRKLSAQAVECIECHTKESPGIVNDWKSSRHAHAGVSCVDCHNV
ncbi:MAG: beta-ketoacyl-ACP synthase, partial [Campylobacter sp.]|nr:beta-ketoacyl-ACP synthase [Campylobacter sp.]